MTECNHDYKKTLARSGMWFINMCHKCGDEKPCCDHESDCNDYMSNAPMVVEGFVYKCKWCGELYR